MPIKKAWSPDDVRALGVVTDVKTACSVLGISQTPGYEQAKAGTFPVPVVRVGGVFRVQVAGLLDLLGITPEEAAS